MALYRSEEERELVSDITREIDRWACERIDSRQIDVEQRIPRDILKEAAELGLFGCSLPEAYGGAELSLRSVCEVVSTLARHDRSIATTIGLHLGLGTRGLVQFASDALKEQSLPALAAGHKIAAFAATEAGAGSDLMAVSTRAVEDDGILRIDGSKIYVTNGGIAGWITILASSPGLGGARRGHSLILLKSSEAGLERVGEEQKLGLRGSSTTSLYFDNVRVPMDRVIGEAGAGMRQAQAVLAWGRTLMAAGCLGMAQAAIRYTVPHVLGRRQFAKRLADLDVVRMQLADAAAVEFAMTAILDATGETEEDAEGLAGRSLVAKIFCSEGSWNICDVAVQLHGGAGFIEESGVPLLLRDARITRIFEGANDVLLVHRGTLCAFAKSPRAPVASAGAGAGADRLHERLSAAREAARAEYGIHLARQPRVLHHLGRLSVLSEVADAVVRRADALSTEEAQSLATRWILSAEAQSAAYVLGGEDQVRLISDALYARTA